ncbi:4-amino-4-deoxy-L-arabinose transferase-like glycosyltransferase [Anseongella ginsenosidimutans]|uniref:4-amino-4-deoxy-L-arabinose transferase-like glycosyltransferase n=1 Tax=Anseongella ginsenosidimutans TaxID=496056 RepID=A0A4R3KYD0_9SPHI|nr:glycosyltransferase family 39 protein [Anseongella ginsenosidimutans]QEC51040.1 hypothetical protein FRZ59_00860 [Anseongella ginsenosidimutans]TCS90304.1 4-amino-4-deoxy-L-arabinose transferase-like glycosyltransferase [Anseongella ginsenosidimutans]
MNKLAGYLQKNPLLLAACCVALLIPAYFINLGLLPLHSDEPTRAVVSMEMIFSGDYLVSTLGGAYYYNKPPLYNWVLAAAYHLGGNFSEFVTRLPAMIPLFLFGASIYLFSKRYLGREIAALAAIFWMTNGRLLTYDSLFGHIDVLYSWLTWLGFMAVIYFDEKKKYWLLFFLTYFITFLGFMMKGLPSFLFQGITLLVFYTYKKEFRRLFSIQHITGFLFLAALLTGYFWVYSRSNSLDGYVATLWDQSIQRTVVEKSVWNSISFFLRFPFESLLHMAPWGLLVVFCFRKGFLREVMANPFLKFNLLILLGNIVVYWLSPATMPKYIFMLYPCIFTLIAYGFVRFAREAHFWRKLFDGLFILVTLALCLGTLYLPFADLGTAVIPWIYLKATVLFLLLLLLSFLVIRLPAQRILVFACVLAVFRLGFSWFSLPERFAGNGLKEQMEALQEIGRESKGNDLYFYYQPGTSSVEVHRSLYYLERERGETVALTDHVTDYDALYFSTGERVAGLPHEELRGFEYNGIRYVLVKFYPVKTGSEL